MDFQLKVAQILRAYGHVDSLHLCWHYVRKGLRKRNIKVDFHRRVLILRAYERDPSVDPNSTFTFTTVHYIYNQF